MGIPIEPASVAEAIKDWYEYWRKFRGKKVRLILKTIAKIGGELGELEIWREIIEGTIEAVHKYPPGFVMKDCEQFVRHERNFAMYVTGQTEPADWFYHTSDSDKRRIIANKFVSFHVIETIEFP